MLSFPDCNPKFDRCAACHIQSKWDARHPMDPNTLNHALFMSPAVKILPKIIKNITKTLLKISKHKLFQNHITLCGEMSLDIDQY